MLTSKNYGYGVERQFQHYFSYFVVVCFIVKRNRSTRRKLPTCRQLLTDFTFQEKMNDTILRQMMMSTLYQTNTISWNFIALQTTVRGQTCGSIRIYFPGSQQTSFSFYSLVLRAQRRSHKIQIFIVFGLTLPAIEPTIYHIKPTMVTETISIVCDEFKSSTTTNNLYSKFQQFMRQKKN